MKRCLILIPFCCAVLIPYACKSNKLSGSPKVNTPPENDYSQRQPPLPINNPPVANQFKSSNVTVTAYAAQNYYTPISNCTCVNGKLVYTSYSSGSQGTLQGGYLQGEYSVPQSGSQINSVTSNMGYTYPASTVAFKPGSNGQVVKIAGSTFHLGEVLTIQYL